MISLDDSFSDLFVLIHGQISEDVALCLKKHKIISVIDNLNPELKPAACRHLYLLQYLKGYSTVVVLQRRDVIVAEREFSTSIYLKHGGTLVNY